MDKDFYYDENRNLIEGKKPVDKSTEDSEVCKDANWAVLNNGDTIIAIKWLPVKGGTDIKKGDKFTNISLVTDDNTHVSARSKVNGKIFLKTEYFKVSSK